MQWINAKLTWHIFTAAVIGLKVTHLFIRWHRSTLSCLMRGGDCHTNTAWSRYDVLKIFNLFQWSYKTAHGPHVSPGTVKHYLCLGIGSQYFCSILLQNWRATVLAIDLQQKIPLLWKSSVTMQGFIQISISALKQGLCFWHFFILNNKSWYNKVLPFPD